MSPCQHFQVEAWPRRNDSNLCQGREQGGAGGLFRVRTVLLAPLAAHPCVRGHRARHSLQSHPTTRTPSFPPGPARVLNAICCAGCMSSHCGASGLPTGSAQILPQSGNFCSAPQHWRPGLSSLLPFTQLHRGAHTLPSLGHGTASPGHPWPQRQRLLASLPLRRSWEGPGECFPGIRMEMTF